MAGLIFSQEVVCSEFVISIEGRNPTVLSNYKISPFGRDDNLSGRRDTSRSLKNERFQVIDAKQSMLNDKG
jgi:hypothetical protein